MNVKNFQGKSVIDSREVAEMVEKQHKNLLADIRSYLKIMEKANGLNFQPVDFFIPSNYQDNKGEDRPCYLITKKGCDMIANKLTGEKGVLFTAAYVTAFENMKQALDAPRCAPAVSPSRLAKLISVNRRVILEMGGTLFHVGTMVRDVFRAYNIPVPTVLNKQVEGQTSLFDPPTLSN